MYTGKNRIGPKTEPCGTPLTTDLRDDVTFLTLTQNVRF
ncbi:unnamed protein product [Tenebrio molitor]|nr:unnamed protein product [Tenebrio molitor]